MNRIVWPGLAIIAILLTGCPERQQPTAAKNESASSRASVTLRLLIVNDPPLVEAINRLRGEWAERTGGELNATPVKWAELAQSKSIDADLLVFPSRYLGDLCSRKLLRPVRASVLEDEDFKSADIFPLVRNDLIKWGRQTFALPLGVDPSALTPSVKAEPAIALLAAAAPQAISNERLGVLFDVDTMKPRIIEPAFVDALGQLAERAHVDEAKKPDSDSKQSLIPVLGFNDRLVAVTASSRNAASAFKLLQWLALPETASQFARTGGDWLPPRRSVASSSSWYESTLSTSQRTERSAQVDATLSGDKVLVIPRIPGSDQYLTALDAAVKSALDGKSSPAAALQSAADAWEQITNRLGRDKQRDAYQKHLGISDE